MRTGCWGRTLLPRKRRGRINRLLRPGGSPASRSPESPFNFTEIRTAPCKASVRRRWRHLSSSRSLPRGRTATDLRVRCGWGMAVVRGLRSQKASTAPRDRARPSPPSARRHPRVKPAGTSSRGRKAHNCSPSGGTGGVGRARSCIRAARSVRHALSPPRTSHPATAPVPLTAANPPQFRATVSSAALLSAEPTGLKPHPHLFRRAGHPDRCRRSSSTWPRSAVSQDVRGVQKLKVRLESGTRGAWVLAPFPPLWERGNRQAVPQSRSERRSPAEVLR